MSKKDINLVVTIQYINLRNMDIANKDRFPHIYALDFLGGDKSALGEAYYEDHEKELEKEFSEIMRTVIVRDNFGGNKKIHNGTER
jgi:hypothetical protein